LPSSPPAKGRLIVFGLVFFYPLAGVTYQFLHYLIGLRQLGFDVYYVEDALRWPYDPVAGTITPDVTPNIARVLPTLERYGFGDRWAYRGAFEGGQCYGMEEGEIFRLYRDADAFLNVTGFQEIREEQMVCRRRLYVESDPFSSQVKFAEGETNMRELLSAHDTHFTFGENIGKPGCGIPIGPFEWHPTRQPVVIDLWDDGERPTRQEWTTITTWKNNVKDVEYEGETYYWTKDREFAKVIDLPRRTLVPLEVAVDAEELAVLRNNGWRQVDAVGISSDCDRYRDYITSSRGEFTVARDQYVRPNTGWFSDRTACYLAAGRPVVTQETGFSEVLPTGSGLLAFRDGEEAKQALELVESDYERHASDARAIAHEYFEASKVLGALLDAARL
jgi:hypothetical protein